MISAITHRRMANSLSEAIDVIAVFDLHQLANEIQLSQAESQSRASQRIGFGTGAQYHHIWMLIEQGDAGATAWGIVAIGLVNDENPIKGIGKGC